MPAQEEGAGKKLDKKFRGPYKVIDCRRETSNYVLDLPIGDKVHPVFHISKLKKYFERGGG